MVDRFLDVRFALLAGSLAFVLALVVGCDGDYRPRAIGKEGEVTVVMDSSLWTGAVGDTFRATVTPWIETLPQPERYFEIRHLELSSERAYESIQDLKNVVIAAPLSDSTNEANFLRRRLSEEAKQAIQNGQSAVVGKPDLWRRSQRVFFVTAATADDLEQVLKKQGEEIRRTFKEITLARMEREMYEDARQFALEDSLMQRHDFAVNVQHDFQIAIDTMSASSGFVWLRRVLARTRREFFVYYEENASPSQLSPEWVYTTHDSLTQEYLRGSVSGFVRIDYRRSLETSQTNVLSRYGYKTRGLWHMVKPGENEGEFMSVGGGGPFLAYAFYDQPTDRLYLLHGSVFAPDFDKLQFLRQMEVMANTFRTREDLDQATDSATVASTE
ncbi:DUF4837 domain-containing protein [Salinibacter sp. 10B]|uniref:DUF4837 family protein n=1 Tax=Salinibacter sp. 10B TaxID=1923971 RepID=UPI000CF47CF1|nr:DUF4837 family protein [Salinibacter sp. 10B]PQJ34190.1 DUF4837 domain-containing protein [Salinibacter sp. 10B]